MTLRRRVQLLLLVLVALLIGDFAADRYLARQRDRLVKLVESRLDPARQALADFLTALIDQEAAERGYLITADEAFLEPYEEGRRRGDEALERLRRLVAADPDLAAAVERIEDRVSAWRQLGVEFEIAAKRAGRDAEAVALVNSGTSQELFDAARREIAELRPELGREVVSRQQRIDQLRGRLALLRAASLTSGVALVGASGWLLASWITVPLGQIRRAVGSVVAGELDEVVPATGPPELADLGADVEAMRQRILSELDDAARARVALAKRGMVILSLREQLAPAVVEPPEGLSLATRYQPAEGLVAGDWYGMVPRDDGRLAIALADVSGHGASAGVFALRTKELTLAALRSGFTPGAAIGWIAEQVGDTGEEFFTGVVVEIDPAAGTLRYANAGHPPVLVVCDGECISLDPTGPLVGPLPGPWAEESRPFTGPCVVAMYSDGLIEGRDGNGVEFGVERLAEVLVTLDGRGPDEVADGCLAAWSEFVEEVPRDDRTLIVVVCGE